MSSHLNKNKSVSNSSNITNSDHYVAKKAELIKKEGHQTISRENDNVAWKIAVEGKKFQCSRSICLTICRSFCLLMVFVFSVLVFNLAYTSGKKLSEIILTMEV